MDSDKKQNTLEKQLKTIGQKTRIEILKKLKNVQIPVTFSKLQKQVIDPNLSSINLSFHLNALKECNLIFSSEEGYIITSIGEQILDKILLIEQIINKETKRKMIRTSKYSKELFDTTKIEEYLVNEGELDRFIARKIAHEVEERLSKTNIEYLTTPLMREYINAILLENSLEEVRHKLTRLGTPPYEVLKLFNSSENDITPDNFINKLGSDVSEQFLLLNLLPKNLADLYLSGEISLLNLNYWSLRPLSMHLNMEALMRYTFQEYPNMSKRFKKGREFTCLILNFINILYRLKQFYSGELILSDFNKKFLSYFNFSEDKSYLFNILASQLLRSNQLPQDDRVHLTLDFNYDYGYSKDCNTQPSIDLKFLYCLKKITKDLGGCRNPLCLIDYSKFNNSSSINSNLNDVFSNINRKNTIFYNGNCSGSLTSSIIKTVNPNESYLILDKILINLYKISVDARQNDDLFLDLLQEKLDLVFKLFDYKEKLVKKKMDSLNLWDNINSGLFGKSKKQVFRNALKSLSFFGLNDAIFNHCGIELDRTENSELFGLKVLRLMNEIIEEKNDIENNNYVLSQPHYEDCLKNSWNNSTAHCGQKTHYHVSRIIRESTTLPLKKTISLFKKFERVISGGTLFYKNFNGNEQTLKKCQQILFNSDLNAFFVGKFPN